MKRRRYSVTVVVAVILLTYGCSSGDPDAPSDPESPSTVDSIAPPSLTGTFPVTVQGVLDGHTFLLSDGTKVRAAGLAAPEECWASAATAFAKAFLLDKEVRIDPVDPAIVDVTPVWLADGSEYALIAVSQGVLRSASPEDAAFKDAENAASKLELGLWGAPCRGQAKAPTSSEPAPAPAPAPPPAKTTPATPLPPAQFGCTVNYRVTHRWQGGSNTDVTITNTGNRPISGWTLRWKFSQGQIVSDMWNATATQSGADVSATNVAYSTTIAAGATQLVGFTAAHRFDNPAPRAFSLNGNQCEIR